MRLLLPDPPLMLITGEAAGIEDLIERATLAIAGGVRWIQLRSMRADGSRPSGRELYEAARHLGADPAVTVAINDRLDIALAAEAGGLHLPASGMNPATARELVGPDRVLGCSVHHVSEIAAVREHVDYVQLGPIYDTASKRRYGPPLGLAAVQAAASVLQADASPRLVAVGGIGGAELGDLARVGAQAVAVISAIWDAPDVAEAAHLLIEQVRADFGKLRK